MKLGCFIAFGAMLLTRAWSGQLSPLAKPPDWRNLEVFQETISRQRFLDLLDRIYAPNGAASAFIEVLEDAARIRQSADSDEHFVLRFAEAGKEKKASSYWKPIRDLPAAPRQKPLSGYTIALDPGHLGGSWAKVEERWFRVGKTKPVAEGDLTLAVAKTLRQKLRELGARVLLVRNSAVPTTSLRPEDLRRKAAASLHSDSLAVNPASLKRESERLFYRVAEIRGRARFLNTELRPDLTLCLHFNAENWGNATDPRLTDINHLHFLVNGCYSAEELAKDDVRFDMLRKLLSASMEQEIALSEKLGAVTQKLTGLPAYEYKSSNAVRVGEFVWARNLLANRLYQGPVVFSEIYVMNNRTVFQRFQMGDYQGKQMINGSERPNIYEEYADALASGLREYFLEQRPLL